LTRTVVTWAANLTREVPVARIELLDRAPRVRGIPPLENGDCVTRAEFERRYEAMPGKTKFELIDGIVYMASPVKNVHGDFHATLGYLFKSYALATPGCHARIDTTVRLGRKDEPQPDAFLLLAPEAGGSSRIDRSGYVSGPVELAAEVATSTASYDLNQKRKSYLRHGVLEYLTVLTRSEEVLWFARRGDAYASLEPDRHGVFRSFVFPGLWIDAPALLSDDGARLQRTATKGLRSREHQTFVRDLRRRLRRGQ
jgi:Uma2 family endonuclease